jgi:phytoene dehydrogenase-like protein
MSRTVDAVLVGSGHNSLVAAAYLARAGWEVEVLERHTALGGCVASEELTLPGFRHDVLSSWHPLFMGSQAYAELGPELEERGLRYVNTDVPTGTAHGRGSAVLAYRDPAQTAAGFSPRDGAAFLAELERFGGIGDLVGTLLGTELHSPGAARTGARLVRRIGPRGAQRLVADVSQSAAGWLRATFDGPEPGLLYAPWVLHTGLAPGDAGGGFQLVALAGGLHMGGMPTPAGGAGRFVEAFTRLIEDHGGTVRAGAGVNRVLVRGGRAAGVRTADGEEVLARRAVVANVTPTQLYGRLLAEDEDAVPPVVRADAARYRYGRGAMQLHLALSAPLAWRDPRLDAAAVVHVADGPEAVNLACAQAAAGLLPAAPTVVVGQPSTMDPERAPAGAAVGWIQLQEVPYHPVGDAAGSLEVGPEGWTDELAAAYADRVLDRIAVHAPNLREVLRAQAVLTPRDLEARNPNLVRGDPYAGSTELDQSYLWRPLRSAGSHRTPVDGLWQIGAATYPGPGLNAASGRIVATQLLAGGGATGAARRLARLAGRMPLPAR